MLIRRLALSGDYADTDWTDPAVTPPENAGRFKALSGVAKFALRGRASSAPDAAIVSLGAMTVDAYALTDLPGGGSARGKSVVEVEGTTIKGTIILVAADLTVGSTVRIHLSLVTVSAPVVELLLLGGGRVLL